MDVGGWLRSLGLGQYEALFRASEIDVDILPELTRSGTASVSFEPSPVWPPPRHRRRLPHRPVRSRTTLPSGGR
jgi:SAM domain (Sterile alpha motif)